MFATYAPSGSAKPALYTLIGVEGAAAGDRSGHQLIAMLFDGAIGAIARARGALASGDVPTKSRSISKALAIVNDGLRASLDKSAPGALPSDLDALYGYVALRLTHANLRNDDAALDECARLLRPLQDAWAQIGPQVRHCA
jgi:flagellar protein FliS